MKVTITALKAPWPEGSQVGSVVELEGDALPAWAVGKCTRVPDGFVAAPAADVVALQAENAALRAMLEAKPADEAGTPARKK
jgi:hypothetical protein